MKDRQTSSSFQPRRWRTFISPLLINEEIEMPLDFFLVAKENAVSFASETRVIDGCASLVEISCIAARPASQDGNRYPKISRTSGIRCTCTVTSVITPSRPSEPSTISRTLGPVEVCGNGRICKHLAWHDDSHAARDVGDVAVLVRLHARGASGDPAAESAVGEAVREVPQSPAPRAQLLLQVWALSARLNARQARLLVNVDHLVQPTKIKRDDRSGLILGSMQAAGDVAASAVRNDHRIRGYGAIDDELHLSLVAGIDHDIRHARNVAGPNPQQVSRALAVGVHDPVKIILYRVLGTDRVGQLRQQLIADHRAPGSAGPRVTSVPPAWCSRQDRWR